LPGISELIQDGVTGALVAPDSAGALAQALAALIADPARRIALGAAGMARLTAKFALEPNLARLARKFGVPAAA
jgi:glycosyltransferase involved in cell wall biosynthesis